MNNGPLSIQVTKVRHLLKCHKTIPFCHCLKMSAISRNLSASRTDCRCDAGGGDLGTTSYSIGGLGNSSLWALGSGLVSGVGCGEVDSLRMRGTFRTF